MSDHARHRRSGLTVGSLVGLAPPRSGALAPPVARRPGDSRARGSTARGNERVAASPCCGSGCPRCPYGGAAASWRLARARR